MIQIEKTSVHDQLLEAKTYATNRSQVEVSLVEPVDYINPIHFFTRMKNVGERFFWKNPSDELIFAGVGTHQSFVAEKGADRFQSIRKAWSEYLANCLSTNNHGNGTGPLLFGGFSFVEPTHETDQTWEPFYSGDMFLPEWMLTEKEGTSYLTHNVTIDQDSDIQTIVNRIDKMKKELNQPTRKEPSTHAIETEDQHSYNHWEKLIQEAIEDIKQGPLEKVVLARKMDVLFNDLIPLAEVIQNMMEQQTNSYIFVIEKGENAFIGATPERLIQVEGNELTSACLAGTTARGTTDEEDEMLAWQLLNDMKNREEHDYVVQMIKQSVAPYCENFNIPDEPVIYPLKTLQHLFTPVNAKLKNGATILDLVKQLHPTPALGGEPRDLALQFIAEKEPFDRGWYAAPVGWLDANFNGEFAVAIRSGVVHQNKATLFAGCGIVKDSDPRAEYEETALKFTPMLDALGGLQ